MYFHPINQLIPGTSGQQEPPSDPFPDSGICRADNAVEDDQAVQYDLSNEVLTIHIAAAIVAIFFIFFTTN
ncbi:hypothetical protein VSDG_07863 [Cytospora chrysosperma]|uniref:Uncharacterized protein n=1 Tax=Cytospora chrysosperma TaxID=252740 RepID=A0A423VJL5_CYTCH|nr:hypothetical protein VSDG_07863 [Valsa sordida]